MTRDRLISFTLLAALLGMTVAWWSQWRQVSYLRDALATSRRVVEQRNAMIAERDKIIQAWVDEHPPGDVEEGKMGGRLIPSIKTTNENANAAILDMHQGFKDFRDGKLGLKIKGSLFKGEASIVLEQVP